MKTEIHIGTSGWYYKHWEKVFYPDEVKPSQKLLYYGEHFATVEVNSTFYHNPSEAAIRNWVAQVPKDFIFSVKANGYITHRKRLKDPEESTKAFFDRIQHFGKKLGPLLFQLPPSFKQDLDRIAEFIKYIPKKTPSAFEFRHESWFNEDTYKLLRKNKIALCLTDLGGKQSPEEITTNFTYIRLHGPKKSYVGKYSQKQLDTWHSKIRDYQKNKISTYCYFDNDEKAYAVHDAGKLISLF